MQENIVNEGKKIRPSNDGFSSYILSKLPIQNDSSSFLGYIIYSLCKQKDIYNELENELRPIVKPETDILLSSIVRDRARDIIDRAYQVDQFRRLSRIMKISDAKIGIDTSDLEKYNNQYLLSSVFITKQSALYDSPDRRTFTDKNYNMEIKGQNIELRCTTQWQGEEATAIDTEGKW